LNDTSEFLEIMSAKLTEAIGPIGPLVLRERIDALGESAASFNEAKIEQLIIQTSIEIPDGSARRQFEAAVREGNGTRDPQAQRA
jgi:hypothetical protein